MDISISQVREARCDTFDCVYILQHLVDIRGIFSADFKYVGQKEKNFADMVYMCNVFFFFKGGLNKLHTTTNIPIPRAFHKINFVDTIVSIYI